MTTLIGNKKLNYPDIEQVCFNGNSVLCDTSSVDKLINNPNLSIDQEVLVEPKDKISEFEKNTDFLPDCFVRAAYFIKISQILQGKNPIRYEVVEFMSSLLNNSIEILIPSKLEEKECLKYFVNTFFGNGFCRIKNKEKTSEIVGLKETLQKYNISAPHLTSVEYYCLSTGVIFSVAVSTICTTLMLTIVDLADATAALSCESKCCCLEPFQMKFNDHSRAHKGQMAVANNLRELLSGTKMCKPTLPKPKIQGKGKGKGKGKSIEKEKEEEVKNKEIFLDQEIFQLKQALSFSQIPQYHGIVRDLFIRCYFGVRIEMNSSEDLVNIEKKGRGKKQRIEENWYISSGSTTFSKIPLQVFLNNLIQSLFILTTGTVQRSKQLIIGLNSIIQTKENEELTETVNEPLKLISESILKQLNEIYEQVQTLFSKAMNIQSKSIELEQNQENENKDLNINSITIGEICFQMIQKIEELFSIEILIDLQKLKMKEVVMMERFKVQQKKKEEALKKRQKQNKKIQKKQQVRIPKLNMGIGTRMFRQFLSPEFLPIDQDLLKSYQVSFEKMRSVFVLIKNAKLRQFIKKALQSENKILKITPPKGTRDFSPFEMKIREKVFNTIRSVFKRHGAVEIDTPVFELKETLTNKYGEDSKLIYDLADQGGEILALRYDLTVPFARYFANNNCKEIRRYHIARVYRRDQPVMSKGRYREFYQCDFDIAGNFETMVPDAEILKVVTEILLKIDGIGKFRVRVNNRHLLDGMLELCGVKTEKVRTVSSSIDKLDKETWENVENEMINEKGIPKEVTEKIHKYIVLEGTPKELLKQIKEKGLFEGSERSLKALDEMETLFDYCDKLEITQYMWFDLSLARGLDYYTGLVYEVILTGGKDVGSIAGGGRYDNLLGTFLKRKVPAVGVSLGIERIFTMVERTYRERAKKLSKEKGIKEVVRESETEVYISSIGPNLISQRLEYCNLLWKNGIKAQFNQKRKVKLVDDIAFCLKHGIPLMVVFGQDEIENGTVKVKILSKDTQIDVNIVELPKKVSEILQQEDYD
ncbi:histidyl-tRNA synthetase [Anaeramoeba flamelloides]|uniref:Histidine--tRNA ligase, cytoplasmic n=1 Tax=Anaeramoeba flamelloides TaxID=1746091 RepID=A0AAV7YF17_9EUKA|nr:histidyl-tRNA synthetase [Anaeramoeba flamelloides]